MSRWRYLWSSFQGQFEGPRHGAPYCGKLNQDVAVVHCLRLSQEPPVPFEAFHQPVPPYPFRLRLNPQTLVTLLRLVPKRYDDAFGVFLLDAIRLKRRMTRRSYSRGKVCSPEIRERGRELL
jgi:hypothetical protein